MEFDYRSLLVLYKKLASFFNNDGEKIERWLSTPNPLFGDISPYQMIDMGRTKKMVEIALHALRENNDNYQD